MTRRGSVGSAEAVKAESASENIRGGANVSAPSGTGSSRSGFEARAATIGPTRATAATTSSPRPAHSAIAEQSMPPNWGPDGYWFGVWFPPGGGDVGWVAPWDGVGGVGKKLFSPPPYVRKWVSTMKTRPTMNAARTISENWIGTPLPPVVSRAQITTAARRTMNPITAPATTV